jgi:hypothetical protein
MPAMRSVIARIDGLTAATVVIGLLVGGLWLAVLPLGLAVSGLLVPVAALVLVVRRRWLEIGLVLGAIGIVPLLAYRLFGPPQVTPPFPEDVIPIELLAPGTAYIFFVLGIGVTVAALFFERRRSSHSA